ncbi:hypothetical protein QJQ45_025379 [Haematococcus lacustris]|nr:hypothetical protein QJQ45_025379 [Haematococcus lacustris]
MQPQPQPQGTGAVCLPSSKRIRTEGPASLHSSSPQTTLTPPMLSSQRGTALAAAAAGPGSRGPEVGAQWQQGAHGKAPLSGLAAVGSGSRVAPSWGHPAVSPNPAAGPSPSCAGQPLPAQGHSQLTRQGQGQPLSAGPAGQPGTSAGMVSAAAAALAAGTAIVVSERQKGNPVLKHIRNVRCVFASIGPDYLLGQNTCALFLSLRYHLLHPEYILYRIKELQRAFALRLLLVLVDVEDPAKPLENITKAALTNDCTLICAWSPQEAARYLETYKAYESKPASNIQERVESDYTSRLASALTAVRGVNRTDALTLGSALGSLAGIMSASQQQLSSCPGLGPAKVARLMEAFHQPFRKASAPVLPGLAGRPAAAPGLPLPWVGGSSTPGTADGGRQGMVAAQQTEAAGPSAAGWGPAQGSGVRANSPTAVGRDGDGRPVPASWRESSPGGAAHVRGDPAGSEQPAVGSEVAEQGEDDGSGGEDDAFDEDLVPSSEDELHMMATQLMTQAHARAGARAGDDTHDLCSSGADDDREEPEEL